MASIQTHQGRFRVKWYDADGRQRYKSFKTRREAETFKDRVEATQVLKSSVSAVIDPDAITLAQWWAIWEPGRKWRDSSRNAAHSHWRTHIKPKFGTTPVIAITSAEISAWHRSMERKGLSAITVSNINGTLKQLLNGAVIDKIIQRNPVLKAQSLERTRTADPVALDASTTAAMLDAVEATTPALAPYARFVAATGLRRQEAMGVTWDRIDFTRGTLRVDRQLLMDESSKRQTPVWGPLKNSKRTPSRTVILTEAALADLRAHSSTQVVTSIDGSGLVFVRPDGRTWSRTQLTDAWQRAKQHLAAQGITLDPGARGWHALRHTVGSRLHAAGVPSVEAAAMLGHTNEEFVRTYCHVVDVDEAHGRLRAALEA